jgi:hypothetical protein
VKTLYSFVLVAATALVLCPAIDALENNEGTLNTITSVPRDMSYQGILKDSGGDPVADSIYNVTFRIFDAESGGTSEWSEILPCTTSAGYFSAVFNNVNIPFDEDYWLELEVDGEILAQRQKMTMVGYSARSDTSDYADQAYDANLLDGMNSSDFAMASHDHDADYVNEGQPNSISNNMIQTDAVTNLKIEDGTILFADIGQNSAAPGQLMKWNGSVWSASDDETGSGGDSDWVISDTNMYSGVSGNVGIGISAPSEKLEVDGNLKTSGKAVIGPNDYHSGDYSFIAGHSNHASDSFSVVSGGKENWASDPFSSVGGGYRNFAYALGATVAGGYNDSAVANYSTIGGGQYNYIYGENGTISGGAYNTVNNQGAAVGGGSSNSANGDHSFIGAGQLNTANGIRSVVGGGLSNDAGGQNSVIAGGYDNTTSGQYTAIAGGYDNSTSNNYCFIGGGGGNSAAGDASTIAGGYYNVTSNNYSAVGGGSYNRALGQASFVGGGIDNVVEGNWSAILGGMGDTITSAATRSYLFGIGSKLTQPSTFMVDMPNIRFGDESTGYDFPTSDGSAGQVMATDGSGQLGWTSAAGGSWSVADSILYTSDYWGLSRGDAGNVLYGDSAHTMINLGVACTTGHSVDLTYYQTISGGVGNKCFTSYTTIGGGHQNKGWGGGGNQTISGGYQNETSGSSSTIGGGWQNKCNSSMSVIAGGGENYILGYASAISGGVINRNLGDYSAIPGGVNDTLDSGADYCMAFGKGVYLNNSYRVAFFDSVFQGKLSINRDDRNGAVSHPIQAGTSGGGGGGGAYLTWSGTWTNASSRNVKDNFMGYDRHDLLEKISSMPVQFWEYRDSDERHIGPVAEDFVSAFDVGIVRDSDGQREDHYLAASDVAGVALAGVKELIEIVNELRDENKELKSRIEELETKIK